MAISSCDIVSQLSVTTLDFQAPQGLGKQPVTYPPCAALILAATAGAQVPYSRTWIETSASRAYSYTENELLLKLDIEPLWTVLSASVHLYSRNGVSSIERAKRIWLVRIRKSRSRYQRGARMHIECGFISAVLAPESTACSPRVQVQLIALAKASCRFPHVAWLALYKRGERKFTGVNWCQSLHCQLRITATITHGFQVVLSVDGSIPRGME